MSIKGRIYKIIHTESNVVYVGSTFNTTRDRFRKHKQHYGEWVKGKGAEISIFPYFQKHGIDTFKIVLIKEYQVHDRTHLEAYEQLWINKFGTSCVNKNNPFRISKLSEKARVRPDDYKDKVKEYAQANSDRIKEYKKQYREANREKLKKADKERYQTNRKAISEQSKVKHDCDCGGKYTTGRARHIKTAKHQKWLQSND